MLGSFVLNPYSEFLFKLWVWTITIVMNLNLILHHNLNFDFGKFLIQKFYRWEILCHVQTKSNR